MNQIALVIQPDCTIEAVDFDNDTCLQVLQNGVGGWIEAVSLTEHLTLWVNEEGKLRNLPLNPVGHALFRATFPNNPDFIVGPVVLTGGTDDEGNTIGLIDEHVADWMRATIANT